MPYIAKKGVRDFFSSHPRVKEVDAVLASIPILWPGDQWRVRELVLALVCQGCVDGWSFEPGERIRQGKFVGTFICEKPLSFRDRFADGTLLDAIERPLLWVVIDGTRGISQSVSGEWERAPSTFIEKTPHGLEQ